MTTKDLPSERPADPADWISSIAFIGGGNMASALIGGLLRQGLRAAQIRVVEPLAEAREQLAAQFGLLAQASAGPNLRGSRLTVWAVKPQVFREAAQAVAPYVGDSTQLSVAAGIGSDSIASWLGTDQVIRAMPNTPALIGKGITALFARSGAGDEERRLVERVLAPTGELLWVAEEAMLDAVTAISGSGPAYVYYFIETMTQAGVQMGLGAKQAERLAISTFVGASSMAQSAGEAPGVLRQRVTSEGGTTHAAISSMEADGLPEILIRALQAARQRAADMGREFGAAP